MLLFIPIMSILGDLKELTLQKISQILTRLKINQMQLVQCTAHLGKTRSAQEEKAT